MLAVVASLSLGVGLTSHGRQLSQVPIGKYSPNTNVLDHANIDLDQKTLEAAFGSKPYDFAAVKSAWQGAGYSKVTITCTLASAAVAVTKYVDADATATPPVVQSGDKISYKGTDGGSYSGKATAATSVGGTTVTFKQQVVADNTNSRVDTLVPISIVGGATIGLCTAVSYAGGRTLAGFSTGAKSKMYEGDCPTKKANTAYMNGCPYTSYTPYYKYYCEGTSSACTANGDYVNQWVLSAADKTPTGLDNFNMDFSTGTAAEETFRKDFLKKVSKFAGAWMYAMREFEDAIDDCALKDLTSNAWSDGAVHAWDEGVAFYVGGQVKANLFYDSVTGEEIAPEDKAGNAHYLAYTLGNKRCKNFKTCGRDGDKTQGEAYVNYELWKAFGDGRDQILAGNCAGAVPVKNHIVELATVPLVQGSLRYAYKCRNGIACSAKSLGELASFAASVLPQVHACSATAATTIATASNPSSYTCSDSETCTGSNNDFTAVKAAFESCYPTMGLTCALVGGLYDSNLLGYMTLAEPCSDSSTATTDELTTGAIIGIAAGAGAAGLLLLCLLFVICKERSGMPLFTPLEGKKGAGSTA